MSKAIKCFKGKNWYLDNFFPCEVEFEGLYFPSVEHAFQGAKTLDMNKRINFCAYPDAATAKSEGRKLKLREDWESVKIDIMRQLVYDKFRRGMSYGDGTERINILQMLLDTGDAYLEEGNCHGDRFWGTVNGEGQNWLGRILMGVRDQLRKELCNV